MTDSSALFTRHAGNPLLSPERWPYSINAVMNAGAARVGDETVLLCRVEDRRGFSHLACARSRDGASNWVIDDSPALAYDGTHPEEEWGLEDPRITFVELDRWIVTYTAFGREGRACRWPDQGLPDVHAAGDDHVTRGQERRAPPAPRRRRLGAPASPDLRSRSGRLAVALVGPQELARARAGDGPPRGGWWDSARIGIGPPPLETEHGWLVVYHGVRQTVAGGLYRAGLALLDLERPATVLRRADEWILGPGPNTRSPATSRTSSSRADSCVVPRTTGCSCTTARRTRASRSPPPVAPRSSST